MVELEISERIPDGRARNGSKPGENNGGGRKPSIEKLKAEVIDIAMAEFWIKLAREKAIPKLQALLECGKSETEMKAAKEILDRALGRPKESMEITGKTELLIDL